MLNKADYDTQCGRIKFAIYDLNPNAEVIVDHEAQLDFIRSHVVYNGAILIEISGHLAAMKIKGRNDEQLKELRKVDGFTTFALFRSQTSKKDLTKLSVTFAPV